MTFRSDLFLHLAIEVHDVQILGHIQTVGAAAAVDLVAAVIHGETNQRVVLLPVALYGGYQHIEELTLTVQGVHGIRGIRAQLDQLLETGLISGSVGMLTDSRSFTSFPRHEYYRRILCDKLGALVENGEYPADMAALGQLVEDICWRNAVRYFGF